MALTQRYDSSSNNLTAFCAFYKGGKPVGLVLSLCPILIIFTGCANLSKDEGRYYADQLSLDAGWLSKKYTTPILTCNPISHRQLTQLKFLRSLSKAMAAHGSGGAKCQTTQRQSIRLALNWHWI